MKYAILQAFNFYKKFIYNEEKLALLRLHNLPIAGSVPPVEWELFGAIMTRDVHKNRYGSDLEGHEIKSSIATGSFEYQYHLRGGRQKLNDDMVVDHVFISYSPDYKDIEVRLMKGAQLKEKFKSWLPALKKNYKGPNRRQRFRRSIARGLVKKNGRLIMKIEKGELVKLVNV
jgi:hypothetical protein